MQDRAFDHGIVDFLDGWIEEIQRSLRKSVVGLVVTHHGQDGGFLESLDFPSPDLRIENPVRQILRSQIVALASSEEACGVGAGLGLRERMVPGEEFLTDGGGMRNAEHDKSFDR